MSGPSRAQTGIATRRSGGRPPEGRLILLGLAVLAVVGAACSSDDSTEAAPQPPPPPPTTDPADYAAAEELLDAFKPAVSVINSDGIIERMASGENSIHMEWNGAAYRSSLENPNLVYVYASDGLTLWQDDFAVPAGAPNLEQAKVFINWMMDPQNIAEATNWNAYGNAIVGSDAFVDDDLASSPMVVPSAEQLSYAAPVETCPLEATDLYDRLWTSFRS